MAREQRTNRYAKGRCQNTDINGTGTPCPKCVSKEIQTRPLDDFVCEECGEELIKIVEKPKSKLPLYAGIGALAIAIVIVVIILILNSSSKEGSIQEPEPPKAGLTQQQIDSLRIDSLERVMARQKEIEDSLAKVAEEQRQIEAEYKKSTTVAKPSQVSGTKDFGYAVFTGNLKNGQPHDTHGTMRFKASHLIESRDAKKRMADPGDYVIGEWVEGHLVNGVWYDSSNTVKGSLLIGQ